jgi:hypothetical protein
VQAVLAAAKAREDERTRGAATAALWQRRLAKLAR